MFHENGSKIRVGLHTDTQFFSPVLERRLSQLWARIAYCQIKHVTVLFNRSSLYLASGNGIWCT